MGATFQRDIFDDEHERRRAVDWVKHYKSTVFNHPCHALAAMLQFPQCQPVLSQPCHSGCCTGFGATRTG